MLSQLEEGVESNVFTRCPVPASIYQERMEGGVEAKRAAEHPARHRTAPLPSPSSPRPIKNHPALSLLPPTQPRCVTLGMPRILQDLRVIN